MNRLTAALFALLLAAFASAPALADTYTYNFTGNCLDCSNPQGQLVFQNYAFGNDGFESSNLVSLTYTSSLADVSVTQSNVFTMEGQFGTTAGSYPFTLVF